MSFGVRLKEIRKEKNISLRDLSALTDISKGYLSRLENNKIGVPKVDTLNKIAKGLGVPNGDLMMLAGYIDDPFDPKQMKALNKKINESENKGKSNEDIYEILSKNNSASYRGRILTEAQKKQAIEMLNVLFKEG
ncbi:helix-turn-helix domain-containing protein [Rossellomorea oryzaecorticis]|uniref:Helix-turn-helix domain-containing protein n=1 Tax=Rossellomorea oryzaecorticis TaxID=1396505 RepID=A0ABU9KAC6_9BACI